MGKLQLLGQRLPVSIETTVPMRVICIQLRGLHDDAVQVPDPIRMNTCLYTQHDQKISIGLELISHKIVKDPEATLKPAGESKVHKIRFNELLCFSV